MTREKAIEHLKNIAEHSYPNEEYLMAIEALEQEPCEDCISREDALKAINKMNIPEDMSTFEIKSHMGVEISTLPPVTPQTKTGYWIDDN